MIGRIAGIALAALLAATNPLAGERPATPSRFASEDARLRAHFERVGRVLAAADVSALEPERRAARARHLVELEAYARRGAFPRHRGEAPGPTPIFVDAAGNRCAMGHLIERAGDHELVARVARTANLARIRDLAGDPELRAWLDRAGLSAAEAGMIQPAYGEVARDDLEDEVPSNEVMGYGTAIGVFLGGASILLNMSPGNREWSDRRGHAVLGTVTGASLLTIGITDWSHDSHLRGTGYFALTVGAAAFTLAQLNLWSGPRAGVGASAAMPDGTRREGAPVVGLAEASAPAGRPPDPPFSIGLVRGRDGEPQLAWRMRF